MSMMIYFENADEQDCTRYERAPFTMKQQHDAGKQ